MIFLIIHKSHMNSVLLSLMIFKYTFYILCEGRIGTQANEIKWQ